MKTAVIFLALFVGVAIADLDARPNDFDDVIRARILKTDAEDTDDTHTHHHAHHPPKDTKHHSTTTTNEDADAAPQYSFLSGEVTDFQEHWGTKAPVALATGSTAIELAWNPSEADTDDCKAKGTDCKYYYGIEYNLGGGKGSLWYSVALVKGHKFVVRDLTPSTDYTWRVTAFAIDLHKVDPEPPLTSRANKPHQFVRPKPGAKDPETGLPVDDFTFFIRDTCYEKHTDNDPTTEDTYTLIEGDKSPCPFVTPYTTAPTAAFGAGDTPHDSSWVGISVAGLFLGGFMMIVFFLIVNWCSKRGKVKNAKDIADLEKQAPPTVASPVAKRFSVEERASTGSSASKKSSSKDKKSSKDSKPSRK